MRGGPFFVGMGMLTLGVLLLAFGARSQTIDVPRIETSVLFDRSVLTVGDVAYKGSELKANWTILCSGSVAMPSSNESGDINFYVMDDTNFQKYKSGERSVDYIIQKLQVSQLESSFVTRHDGMYYFVFDNSYETLYKKEVTFSALAQYTEIYQQIVEDRTLNSYGYPLIAVGAVATIYGLVRKADVRWA